MSDPYSRVEYRRFIAWEKRIAREWPFLRDVFRGAPSRRLLDLGCGTGEHARFLAARGFQVTGVDASETMLAKATEEPVPGNLRFVRADLTALDTIGLDRQGGALCLGNTLPHLRRPADLKRFLEALADLLEAGSPLVVQLLNYQRIRAAGVRHLPLNFSQEADGEILFLRLMDPHPDGRVTFYPSTLELLPGADPPLRVRSSKKVELFGWSPDHLRAALAAAGFGQVQLYGDFTGKPFVADEAHDLILVAVR